ncbi:MAG TPA: hypothetical protein VGI70_09065, partial [Polyangiales bacterium]
VMLATVFGVRAIAERFTRFKGPSPVLGTPRLDNISGFFGRQLPNLLGGHNEPLRDHNILSALSSGHSFVSFLLLAWFGLCVVLLRPNRKELSGFPAYLLFVGGGQAAAFMLFVHMPFDPMLLRYVLLCLLGVVGLIALAWRRPALRAVTLAVFLLCTCTHVWDDVRLEHEYAERVPLSDTDRLASALSRHGVHYAWADYWVAYELTFRTHGRLRVAPTYDDRIPRLHREVEAHATEAVRITKEPCLGAPLERVGSYYICPPALDAPGNDVQPTAADRRASDTLEL